MPKTVLLIDAMFEAHKHFGTNMRTLSTKAGIPTGITYGFLRGLASYVKQFGESEIIVCWDGTPKRRIAIDPNYKAGRVKTESTFYDQIKTLQDALQLMGIMQLRAEDEEADDLLAAQAIEHSTYGHKVIIVTGDDDLLQMVSTTRATTGPVTVYNPRFKVMYDEVAVHKKYGVKPQDLCRLWAIQGDPSDNIQGFFGRSGESEKEVVRLVNSFGDLKTLIANSGHPPITNNREAILRNETLIELQVDISEVTPTVPHKDEASLRALFEKLEFASFTADMAKWLTLSK